MKYKSRRRRTEGAEDVETRQGLPLSSRRHCRIGAAHLGAVGGGGFPLRHGEAGGVELCWEGLEGLERGVGPARGVPKAECGGVDEVAGGDPELVRLVVVHSAHRHPADARLRLLPGVLEPEAAAASASAPCTVPMLSSPNTELGMSAQRHSRRITDVGGSAGRGGSCTGWAMGFAQGIQTPLQNIYNSEAEILEYNPVHLHGVKHVCAWYSRARNERK